MFERRPDRRVSGYEDDFEDVPPAGLLAQYGGGIALPLLLVGYGVACLAQARDYSIRKSIIWGKHVTGHAIEYDYKDNTGVLDPETGTLLTRQSGSGVNLGPPFYTLEYMLRDATGPDGQFHGNVGHATSVIVDFPFITGRSTPDSTQTGEKLVEVLEHGLRRFGW